MKRKVLTSLTCQGRPQNFFCWDNWWTYDTRAGGVSGRWSFCPLGFYVFMFSSVWAWQHLEARVDIRIEASLFDAPDHGAFTCVIKVVWPVFGDHMEAIVNFAPSWWNEQFVNVWVDSGIGTFIASLSILMEILGLVAWLELKHCWMEKNNPSLDQVSVCIYHQKSCLPVFPKALIV